MDLGEAIMGIRESVARLVHEVEAGRFMEATDAFYADDASTIELTGIVTVGKPALLAKERDYQPSSRGITSRSSTCSSTGKWR